MIRIPALIVSSVLLLLALSSSGDVAASPPDIPPLPDPKSPVNYTAWLEGVYKPPTSLDAGPHYKRVQRFLPFYGNDDEQLAPFIKSPWREESREIASRFIKYEWAMTAFIAATDKQRYFLPLVPFGDFADFKVGMDMAVLRIPSKVVIAQAWRSFAGGDQAGIVDAARRTLMAASHLAQQPLVTAQYRAADLSDLAAKTLLRAIHYATNRSAFVGAHANTVLGFTFPQISAARGFSGEQLGAYDTIQRCFGWDAQQQRYILDERGVDRALTLDGWRQPEVYERAVANLSSIDFVETRGAVRDYYDLIYRTLELPDSSLDEAKQALVRFGDSHTGGPLASMKFFKPELVVATRRRQIEAMIRWHGMRLVWQVFADRETRGMYVEHLRDLEGRSHDALEFAQTHDFAWSFVRTGNALKLSLAPITGASSGTGASAETRVFVSWPVD